MCRKKAKKQTTKKDEKSSQEKNRYERVLWRPSNPWPLP